MYKEFKEELRERLFAERDEAFGRFSSRLLPETDPESIVGVRVPVLRALAKELYKDPHRRDDVKLFMSDLPHSLYEENSLHAFFIELIRDEDECFSALEAFLPYVDNWAVCDTMRPKAVARNKARLYSAACAWMNSEHTYTVRYGIEVLMNHFLREGFSEEQLERVASVRSDEYYVKMMKAWYFAEALAYRYDSAVAYIEERRLDVFSHNKAIQKAKESRKIGNETKRYLNTLRVRP